MAAHRAPETEGLLPYGTAAVVVRNEKTQWPGCTRRVFGHVVIVSALAALVRNEQLYAPARFIASSLFTFPCYFFTFFRRKIMDKATKMSSTK